METFETLDSLVDEIANGAQARGLVAYPAHIALLELRSTPIASWTGSWEPFLDLAKAAGAPLVYTEVRRYDPRNELERELAERPHYSFAVDIEQIAADLIPRSKWEGRTMQASYIWFAWPVGHSLVVKADWADEVHNNLIESIGKAERRLLEEKEKKYSEEARTYQGYGDQLGRHERWPDATNDSRWEFMAIQLFPDIADDPQALKKVIERAGMVYWYYVEPQKADQAREMYRAGESAKTIRARLKMSEAKFNEAIAEFPPQARDSTQ